MSKPPAATHDCPTEQLTPTGDGFLGRWSRRKQARAEDVTPLVDAVPEPDPDADADPDSPALTDADMPALESLGEDSDYSGFLSPGVSEGLRRAALRKLFGSAMFNVTDGLDDYDEDFTSFEALGDIITSDMRHAAEVEARRAEERARLAHEEERAEAAGAGPDPEEDPDEAPSCTDPATALAVDDAPVTDPAGQDVEDGRDDA